MKIFESIGLRNVCLVVFVTYVSYGSSSVAEETKPEAMAEFEQTWQRIVNLQTPADVDPSEFDYWVELHHTAWTEFYGLASSKKRDEWLEFFVAQFGKKGAKEDIRWMVTCPNLLLPFTSGSPGKISDHIHSLHMKVCRLIVERCVSDKDYLRRYYNMVLWSGRMFRSKKHHVYFYAATANTRRGLSDERLRKDFYWWYARNFVILAHATSRDDLLAGIDPTKVEATFQQWSKWLNDNASQLSADTLFPRWVVAEKDNNGRLPDLKLPREPFPNVGEQIFPKADFMLEFLAIHRPSFYLPPSED